MTTKIIAVDLQNDFATEGGALYNARPSVAFLRETFLPFVSECGYPVAEIISDYRATDAGTSAAVCVPGQWGYQSIIPSELKYPHVWVKAEPSPTWIRQGGRQATHPAGAPYPDPNAFSAWLSATIGAPNVEQEIILIGLMLEICVFSTLQELKYRGYRVKVLFEGVDTYTGDLAQKRQFFAIVCPFWGQTIAWEEMNRLASDR